ncbi:hypothetical protein N7508_005307 [Penicillium antarcticum]|uniref:uncharacterized protein n=1 Tax=Penicillium antarcticum TaxID=416450 RepID=UPI002384B57D|nr:uncharacterized protein N7508_005307 [Penicillium antarcticum]KAJ5306292.1 hypothetical protein N7508_005307 [Penicillium antarcticum]
MPFATQPLKPQKPPRPVEAGMPELVDPTGPRSPVYTSWKQHESVGIDLSQVPRAASTHDIYDAFQKEGTIVKIDLYETSDGRTTTRAFMRFSPPPERDFWSDGCYEVPLRNGPVVLIGLSLNHFSDGETVPSPVRSQIHLPAQKELMTTKVGIGVLVDARAFHTMHNFDQTSGPRFVVDVLRRCLYVYFKIGIRSKAGEMSLHDYRVRITFLQLSQIFEQYDTTTELTSFLIILDSSPTFHRRLKNIALSFTEQRYWREEDVWYRQTSVRRNPHVIETSSNNLKKSGHIIDTGRWNVFKITFASELKQDGQALNLTRAMLKDYNISIEEGHHLSERRTRPLPVWHWIDHVGPQSSKASLFLLQDMENDNYVHLHMHVRYQLEVCMSHGYLSEFTMTREFVETLSNMKTAEAQRLLEHVATQKKKYFDPMEIFDLKASKGTADTKIPDYCSFMRTARVTPTTIYYNTPSVDASNRIVRKYSEVADHFLRVRFTDEKTEGRINSSMNDNNNEVFSNVKRTLSNGITIGDRHYEFLAFGNSQFREHGAYFFAKGGPITAASIRAWMGQFSHIRNVAKYAARLGQCFSTTRAFSSTNVDVARCEDIVRNGYLFSDGVGKISKFLAQMAKNELNIKTPTQHLPSAFQFRLGGSKGMLVLSPDPRPREVHIRPSQYKFSAESNGLEIIRWSQFSFAALNRQIIIVLSALGITDRALLSKLDSMLSSFNDAMKDDQKANDLLQKWIDPNQMTLTIAQMITDGFRQANEPYVCTLLELWRAWHLKHLKEKAKITVEQGANLLGCLDEVGVLKGYFEDQMPKEDAPLEEKLAALPEIFVQICRCERQDDKDAKYEIIQGVCILARNPSLHPGDIRVVRAVNRPELEDYRDVVVLPQTGDRDIASMCSGGDLDGDDYLVIWDPDLIPAQWFTNPIDYASRRVPDLFHDVTVDAITSFFVVYMKNDCLPKIAHAHLALADWLPKGVMEMKCLRLAQLHSDAVDFNKTGAVAVMTKDLRPTKWPHFMEKRHVPLSRTYRSKKILGQLYDAVNVPAFLPNLEKPFDARILTSPQLEASEEYMVFAKELKEEYDMAMRQIMAQYEIETEFEIVSGFTLHHCFPGKDYKMQEDMGRISGTLRGGFRHQCYDEVERTEGNIAALVLAMYRVTDEEMTAAFTAHRQEEMLREDLSNLDVPRTKLPLISFPWIFPEVLGNLAKSKIREPAGPEEVAADDLPDEPKGYVIFTATEAQIATQPLSGGKVLDTVESPELTASARSPSPSGYWEPLDELFDEEINGIEYFRMESPFDEAITGSLRNCRFDCDNENRVHGGTGSLRSMGSWYELVQRRDEFSAGDEERDEGVCLKEPVEIDMVEDAGVRSNFKRNPLDELLDMLG